MNLLSIRKYIDKNIIITCKGSDDKKYYLSLSINIGDLYLERDFAIEKKDVRDDNLIKGEKS